MAGFKLIISADTQVLKSGYCWPLITSEGRQDGLGDVLDFQQRHNTDFLSDEPVNDHRDSVEESIESSFKSEAHRCSLDQLGILAECY